MNNLLFRYRKFISSSRQITQHDGKEIFYADEVEEMLSVALADNWIDINKQKPNESDLVLFKTATGHIEISRLNNQGWTTKDVKDIVGWLPIPERR